MAYHLTTERTVLLRAPTLTFKLAQKTSQFSTSHSHFYSATSDELPKQRSSEGSKGRDVVSFNWFDVVMSPLKVVSLRKKGPKLGSYKAPLLFTPSYQPVPFTPLSTTPPGSEHAGSSTINKVLNPMQDLLRQLNEVDLPGRYLAIDCEMVGVGINASESSLGRVSLVNYHGKVILDEFVKPKEHVVDYRTRWSGIRASDMVNAKSFEEVQKMVIDLLDGRILIGHAIHHDLKALLLSHPTENTRDTQIFAHKFALSRSRLVSLKNLVKQELGVNIQTGEHSSVQDARATMGIYRLHKNVWERGRSIRISQIQAPEPTDLWNSDGKFDTILKKKQLVERLGIFDIRTGEHSSVVEAKLRRGEHPLVKNDWRASGSISQIEGSDSKTNLEPTTFERSAQQELGNDIQTGEHSSVVDAKSTGVHPLNEYDVVGRASGLISQMRGPSSKTLWKMHLQPTVSEQKKVAQPELGNGIQTGEHSSVVDAQARYFQPFFRKYDTGRASELISQIRGLNSKVLSESDLKPKRKRVSKQKIVAQQELGNDIQTGEHSSAVDAKATSVHPLDEYDVERANELRSQRRIDLEVLSSLKLSTSKRWDFAKQEVENDFQTAKHSSAVDAKATSVHPLDEYDVERASELSSQIGGFNSEVSSKSDLRPSTFKRWEVAQQELGNDIQTAKHSSVVLAKTAGVYRSQNNDSQRASRRNSKPKTKGLWDLVLETESTASKGREVGKSELGIQTVEHSNVVPPVPSFI